MADIFCFRVDSVNPRHVGFTVFANGANAGMLTLTQDEFISLAAAMNRGAPQHSFEVVPLHPAPRVARVSGEGE